MKIIEEFKPKKVKYFGMEILVPYFTKFLAVDKNGTLVAFKNRPYANLQDSLSVWIDPQAEDLQEVAIIELENFLWTDTLQEV